MHSPLHYLLLGLTALLRNRLQTALAMLGVTVGVGALVASLALGRGAQESIKDQLLAAGANMIVVTAGNYATQKTQGTEPAADHARFTPPVDPLQFITSLSAARRDLLARGYAAHNIDAALRAGAGLPASTAVPAGHLRPVHFEDDPMAEHDHPTAKERLGDSMAGLGAAATLTLDDAVAIREQIPGVQFAASGVHENARIAVDGDPTRQWFTRMHGTESRLPDIRRGWVFPFGEFLTEQQVADAEQVMVLGRFAADKLFGAGTDPVGKRVILWNQPFEVVGVVGSTSWAQQPAAGDDQFDALYIPVTTVHRLLNLSKLNTITVTTASAGDTTRIAGEITALLRQRHGIGEAMADDFTVRTQAQEMLGKGLSPELARIVGGNLATMEQITIDQLSTSLQRANRTMLALLAGVATVSLLVGGIGVMNLLLLSVTQRTREVGLRMALGARRLDIARQFVSEAVVLCLVGGVLGAGFGVLAANGLEEFFQWSTAVSPLSAVLAIAVAAVLGVISGVYPASRAAQLDPIGALQHE
jgi:putative ABC transport system permease protein